MPISKELVRWRLRKLRRENTDPNTGKWLSQEGAAARVDVATYRQWQRWEAMHSLPRADKLAAIAEEFGFDVGEFSGEDSAPGQEPAQLDRMELRLAETQADVAEIRAMIDRLLRILAADRPGRGAAPLA